MKTPYLGNNSIIDSTMSCNTSDLNTAFFIETKSSLNHQLSITIDNHQQHSEPRKSEEMSKHRTIENTHTLTNESNSSGLNKEVVSQKKDEIERSPVIPSSSPIDLMPTEPDSSYAIPSMY